MNPLKKIYGNAVVLRNLRGQTRIPYLSVGELQPLRDQRLRSIIAYAAKTVPYYQTLFKESRIDPREIRTVEDLDRLPLLDKDTVRNAPHSFVSGSTAGRKSIHFVTSGTTGKPLDIYHDVNSLLANIAFGERERDVTKKFLSHSGNKELYLSYSTSTIRKVWEVYRQWTYFPVQHHRHVLSVLEPFDHLVNEVNRYKPTAILGYGSFLEMFFRTIHLRSIQIHLPKILLYAADSMTKEGRNLIEQSFGIPVLSTYNTVEIFKMGYFCEERKAFHLHEDLCHVKIINSHGEKLKVGEKGEVVISNFVNHGSVLLNYRLGDVASLSDTKCSCGRTSRLLSELEGRIEDTIFLPNHEFVHPRAVWNVFKAKNEVLQYQLIQHEQQRFELKLVTADRSSYDAVIGEIRDDLNSLLGGSSIVECEFYEELDREGRGKFRPVISHCKPEEYK